ncbi:GntR family transcriptional regulator [Mobilibacterium timonense]|uniref:GntR family transcriptional regulator n=1 Tax=Mobilibacterium timonense TaxID=1871012 RepID=UPI000985C05F|nr:GntR family transcriptional regulator [Mobilibacterium timonense]
MIVKPDTLRDQAYKLIRNQIVTRELPLGSHLSVADLSRDLGISNSPIREAISRLENEGLVINHPNSGFHVLTFDDKLVDQLNDTLIVTMSGCYQMCCEDGQEQDLAELLQQRLDQQASQYDGELTFEYVQTTINFDKGFVDACHNDMLSNLMESRFYLLALCAFYLYQDEKESYLSNFREHQGILEKVKTGDREEVFKAIQFHLTKKNHYNGKTR